MKRENHMLRKGPHPLPLHLGISLSGLNTISPNDDYTLYKNFAQIKETIRGIQLYQSHPYKPRKLKLYEQHNLNGTRILSINKAHKKSGGGVPLLLVPSLINRYDILDLSKDRSLLRYLSSRGRDVYMLDWGDFIKNGAHNIDIEGIICDRLLDSIRFVSKSTASAVDVLGYCMGGTLLMAAAVHEPNLLRRIALLAAPWDFHAPEMTLSHTIRLSAPLAQEAIMGQGKLSAHWLQTLFAAIDPDGSAQKFARFSQMDQDTHEAKLFILVEDWLNNGIDIPANVAQHCLRDWFTLNAPYKGEWRVGGKEIIVQDLQNKILLIASNKDRLVPARSAFSLANQLKAAHVSKLELSCGHIGFIAGKNSIRDVWEPLNAWFDEA